MTHHHLVITWLMEKPPEMQQDNQCRREPTPGSPSPSSSSWLLTVPSSACCDRRWEPAGPVGTPSVSAAGCSWCQSTCSWPWCAPPGRCRWWPDPWGTWTSPGTSGSPSLHPPFPQIAFCSPAMEMLLTVISSSSICDRGWRNWELYSRAS